MLDKTTEPGFMATKLSVESPMPDELIKSGYCCFMFRANIQGKVEASVDSGPWQPCRNLMGYWWLDWECKKAGRHHVVARLQAGAGPAIKTERRMFRVG
ncbi:MAG: hypothetical protein HY927_03475 [Elusimicrobia bacterium]|nr:hypothetical protein [Elusimicrobiota bacterium]